MPQGTPRIQTNQNISLLLVPTGLLMQLKNNKEQISFTADVKTTRITLKNVGENYSMIAENRF